MPRRSKCFYYCRLPSDCWCGHKFSSCQKPKRPLEESLWACLPPRGSSDAALFSYLFDADKLGVFVKVITLLSLKELFLIMQIFAEHQWAEGTKGSSQRPSVQRASDWRHESPERPGTMFCFVMDGGCIHWWALIVKPLKSNWDSSICNTALHVLVGFRQNDFSTKSWSKK